MKNWKNSPKKSATRSSKLKKKEINTTASVSCRRHPRPARFHRTKSHPHMTHYHTTTTPEGIVTIHHDTAPVAITFNKSETMQYYLHQTIISDDTILRTEQGIDNMHRAVDDLVRYAETTYPWEFQHR